MNAKARGECINAKEGCTEVSAAQMEDSEDSQMRQEISTKTNRGLT